MSGIALVAKGGTAPYAYSILATSSNDLPPGLSADPLSGQITGTPSAAGHYTFIAEVQDGASNVFAQSFSIEVLAQLFWIGPPPPPGEVSVPYSYRFRVRNASGVELTSGFTYSGTLPASFSLGTDGTLSGTTASDGISYFTVHATDGTDTLDIPVALTVYPVLAATYLEDRDPPNGWGGGSGTWLPSMIRFQDWIAHLVIAGGVPPYSLRPSDIDPPPTGIKVMPHTRTVAGRTSDPADPANPTLMSVFVSDALGKLITVQRAVFIIDSPQGRIQPQKDGADVSGGDGPTKLNFAEDYGIGIDAETAGGVSTFTVRAKLWQPKVSILCPASAFPDTYFYDPRGDWMNVPGGTINAWDITCDVPGSAEMTIQRASPADYPTFTDLFTASITSAVTASATGLSHEISAGDWMRVNFNGPAMADFNRLLMRMRVD